MAGLYIRTGGKVKGTFASARKPKQLIGEPYDLWRGFSTNIGAALIVGGVIVLVS
ncbi:MAG: hypothetical protein HY267_00555 [Deltaproteobacteria bacterium]|nr:hypothetical protein [Deltaproteobacteria bacterium]